ncbi:MAG: AMP-binding protein [Bacteroidales bacterium]
MKKLKLDTSRVENLWDMLENCVEQYPDHKMGFISDKGETSLLTYADLRERSLQLLGGLRQKKISSGDNVILAIDKNEETIPILWACIAGNVVPTILQPPVSFSTINPALEKIEKVYEKLGAPMVIVSEETSKKWMSKTVATENVVSVADIPITDLPPCLPEKEPDETAYIQFSSGSTGDPKGVVLTHRNLVKNVDAITRKADLGPWDTSLSWMPLYHDMGLIGFHFTTLFSAMDQYSIDPVDFIKNPFLWLDHMSAKKVSVTGSPNFGQIIVNRHLKRKTHKDWDFSPMKVLFNGAEPISPEIMNEFLHLLSRHHFKPEAMMPVYGMAEATLAVTFSPLKEKPLVRAFDRQEIQVRNRAVPVPANSPRAMHCVSVGKAIEHCQYRITDAKDTPLEEKQVGHIQVTGENVCPGYYHDPEATAGIFSGHWLRTGDMGFTFEGNLYVTGRHKDIIFVRGQNIYANDMEAIATRLEGVSYGKVVIGGVFDEIKGQDRIIIFLVGSLKPATAGTFLQLKKLFRETMAITPDVFIPVKSNEIPKTSSGKIQRYKLIRRYLHGEFDETGRKMQALMKGM